MDLRDHVRLIPDFPRKGIMFRDLMPLMSDPHIWNEVIKKMANTVIDYDIDLIIGIEARGFIVGASLASYLHLGFVPVRKKGKLPGNLITTKYDLEYGSGILEIQEEAFKQNSRIYIVDDLLATGGTARATAELVQKANGKIVGFGFVVELAELMGRKEIKSFGLINSLITYN